MRKNDLIKYLQEIEGNPEIVFWNGYTESHMKMRKPQLCEFGRESIDMRVKMINWQRERDNQALINKNEFLEMVKKGESVRGTWHIDPTDEFYDQRKKMILLQAYFENEKLFWFR